MKDLNCSECKFSAEMVSYMYDELPSAECMAFEQHLADCTACTDEFAAIAGARYEVYDWKKMEFDSLETPRFEISYAEPVHFAWSDRIRAVFANGWTVPAVSFAALIVVSILAFILISPQSGKVEIATTDPGASTDTASVPVQDDTASTVSNNITSENLAQTKNSISTNATPKRVAVSRPATRNRVSTVAIRTKRQSSSDGKPLTARNAQKAVPTLNDFAEDEDDSLRLAELFEKIGSR